MRTFPLLLIPVLVVAACSDDSSTPETSQSDTSASAAYTPSDSARPVYTEEADTVIPVGSAFEPAVYRAFARRGVAVPKSVTDSLFQAIPDKRKIPQEMERLMDHYDSLARKQVAERFSISEDSLARILVKASEEKW
jgi:hypothetical protein